MAAGRTLAMPEGARRSELPYRTARHRHKTQSSYEGSQAIEGIDLMPPNVCVEAKMTVVSRSEDDTRENVATTVEPTDEDRMLAVQFAWVGGLSVPVLVLDDRSRRVIAYNVKMESLIGVSSERIIGRSIECLLSEGSKQAFAAAAHRVLDNGESSTLCDLTLSETTKRFALNISAHRGGHGKSSQLLCFGEEVKGMDVDPVEPPAVAAALESAFPMAVIDAQGQITGWNLPLEAFTGHRMEDVMGRCLQEYVPKRQYQELLRRTVALSVGHPAGKCCFVDFVLRNCDLKRVLVNITAGLNQHTKSYIHYLILSDAADLGDHDNSVSSASNLALHDKSSSTSSDEDLRQIVDNANTAIFGVDASGKVNEWNAQTHEITGFTAEEALNADLVATFIAPDFQPQVEELLHKALRGRGMSNFELEMRTKEGELRYLLVNTTPRLDAQKEIVGVIAFAQDITEACKHDRAVAAMANELRKLIDTANAPIFGIDKDG